MTISELLSSQRAKLNLTLDDVGRHCGVHRSIVLRWERGDIQKIKRDKLEALCDILEIDPVILTRPREAITREEYALLTAFRNADYRAREDAMKMLIDHSTLKKEEQLVI